MIDVFRECRERVSAQDAARHYGLTFDRKGWAVCPFHRDKHPSMSFRSGRFRCWACNASGDSIDFTARLFGLEPLAAVERLNADFALGFPLHRQPTPEDLQTARRRREVVEAHRDFEAWRADMIQRLNACLRLAHLTMKNADLNRLTDSQALAIREQARLEWLSDTLSGGETEQQMQIFRERGRIGHLCERILHQSSPMKSGAA